MALIRRVSISCLILAFAISFELAASENPLGEMARYTVDKDPKRTSSMIKSGRLDAQVSQFLTESSAYEVAISYTFQVQFAGNQQGTEKANIDESYFEDAFLENLRQTGHYAGAEFKADHIGYADAKNLDGKFYAHCDKIKFYEIKQSPSYALYWLATSLLGGNFRADIENLVVIAHVFPNIPVLGGAKVDVSGTYQGIKIKAGGDYVSPKYTYSVVQK